MDRRAFLGGVVAAAVAPATDLSELGTARAMTEWNEASLAEAIENMPRDGMKWSTARYYSLETNFLYEAVWTRKASTLHNCVYASNDGRIRIVENDHDAVTQITMAAPAADIFKNIEARSMARASVKAQENYHGPR